ncbi:MAG: sulfate permease [bacterium]|nr:sulfate permease [bacterium]
MRFLAPDLTPKLITTFRDGYTRQDLTRDVLAGLVVGIVALPLSIAFGIASGVRPEQGLFTAIVAGFLISAFGGSRVQIGGPTGAFVVIVAGIVAKFGYAGLAIATIMAGALLVAMSIARLGNVIKFIPYPVIIGFTSGIAIIIAMGQIGDGLGLPAGQAPAHFWPRCHYYIRSLPETNLTAAAICLGSVLITQQWTRVSRRVPGPLVALLLATIVVKVFDLPVDTIGSRFGEVPTGLPRPSLPRFDFTQLGALFSPALSIALLGAIESLLSAMVADGMIGGRHRANAELMGQGIANLVVPFFGGIPATGAIARTATNVKNGGRSPVAGIVHALTLLLILMVAGKWAAYIPLATLAGILLVVAYNMSEWRVFRQLLRSPRGDVLVLLSTFILTVVVDLNVAIQVGMVLSSVLLMLRMAEVTQVRAVRDALDYETAPGDPAIPVELPPEVAVFEINGTFCFGAARSFTETLQSDRRRPRVVILRMRHVMAIDATGLHALEDVQNRLRQQGTTLLLSGVHAQPLAAMTRAGAVQHVGLDNMFSTFPDAVARAREIVAMAR